MEWTKFWRKNCKAPAFPAGACVEQRFKLFSGPGRLSGLVFPGLPAGFGEAGAEVEGGFPGAIVRRPEDFQAVVKEIGRAHV